MPRVYGVVTDADTGKPLMGVGVTLGQFKEVTGPDGSFSIEAPAGTYKLVIMSPIYRPFVKTIPLSTVDVRVDVKLHKAVPI